jgi:hypothetical protein
VDLAGSEKLSSHENGYFEYQTAEKEGDNSVTRIKDRVIEGKNINKSLFFLTQVI